VSNDPKGYDDAFERERLLDEIHRLKVEVHDLRQELDQIKNSKWFKIRQRLLPSNSVIQRLYKGVRTGSGLKELRADPPSYDEWRREHIHIGDDDERLIQDRISAMIDAPIITLIVPVGDSGVSGLDLTMASLVAQSYPFWELLVVGEIAVAEPRLELLTREKRIKRVSPSLSGSTAADLNQAVHEATGAYVGIIDSGDAILSHGLFSMASALGKETDLIYSDEDAGDADHRFKPDWDPVLELGRNYVSRLCLFRSKAVQKIGGFRTEAGSSYEWDLILRLTEVADEENILHVPHVLYHRPHAVLRDTRNSGVKIVAEALVRRGEDGDVVPSEASRGIEVWRPVAPEPMVTVLIPTRDRADLLSKCLDTLRSVTTYRNFEIIVVDNGTREEASVHYLESLATDPRIRVIRDEGPFNYSRLNNLAAEQANGEILALLNNDVEITEPRWMTQLVAYATMVDVGAVGARLLYPDGSIQHGGVIIGFQGVAGHAHVRGHTGYDDRAVLDQTLSAVTAACLFVKKELYHRVGGLDEGFAVSFNDIDFCLKLRQLGLRNIYAGTAACIHHESVSRGSEQTPENRERFHEETKRFQTRWRDWLENDPYYNPNLSLTSQTYVLSNHPRCPLPWRV
jgi:GT2 family glycosyltransferase